MILSAIEKEVVALFEKAFFAGDLSYTGTSGEITITNTTAFLIAALRRVAEETVTEMMPEKKDGCICGLGTNGNKECLGQCSEGFNAAVSEMHQNFIKFTEKI